MSGHVRVGGAWKTVAGVSTRVGGTWKTVTAGWTKVGGVWKQWFTSAPAPAMELITSTVLAANQNTITFSSIPQTYKHLEVRYSVRNSGNTPNAFRLRFNNSSLVEYAAHYLFGNGSSVVSSASTSAQEIAFNLGLARANPTTIFSAGVISIMDYTSSTKNTTVRALNGVEGADSGNMNDIRLLSGLWNSTAAVTRIDFSTAANSFATGSRFSLYGIKG